MFVRKRDLQIHAKRHISVLPGPFKCDECAKSFNEEGKLNAHKKSHKSYSCEQCDKTFSNQMITDKHKKIAHGTSKMYCHFFNNNEECPFEENCIFLHEDSEQCKYGEQCDGINCMYKHKVDVDNDDDNSEDEEVKDDLDENAENTEEKYKCVSCPFETTDKEEFENHRLEICWR